MRTIARSNSTVIAPPSVDLVRPQISTAGNLSHDRAGCRNCRNQLPLLFVAPHPAPLRPRYYCDLTHRTVPCTGANTSACTGAISKYQPITARRPSPERYVAGLMLRGISQRFSYSRCRLGRIFHQAGAVRPSSQARRWKL
jgi:hypothetical protein